MALAHRQNTAPDFDTDRQLIAGRFHISDRIGRGRLGEIFAATDNEPDDSGIEQRLAIQVIPEDIVRNNRLFNQLNVGYSTLRRIAHPNIVGFHQYGRDGRCGFLVMEHLAGASLRYVLDEAGPLPLDEVKPIVGAIGNALKLLHDSDMLHGNLTARNVFITEELDVRLLDVVPLGAEQAVIPGGATSSPFSRCSVADDVLGLACLAYEMLSGKHPYNDLGPVEARLAGLGAERIPSLPDREWRALSSALSFDDDERKPSLDEFLLEFGSGGALRLKRSADEPARYELPDSPAFAPPTVARLTPATQQPPVPVAASDPIVTKNDRPQNTRPASTKTRMRRPVLLLLLLAALAAWYQFGQHQAQMEQLFDNGNENLAVGLSNTGDRRIIVATSNVVPPVAGEEDVTDGNVADITVADIQDTATSDQDTDTVPPLPAPSGTDAVASVGPATALAGPAGAPDNDAADRDGELPRNPAADSNSVDTADVPSPATADEIFAAPVVSVSERDGAVLITLPRAGYSTSSPIWWTSEHTAKADEDFIHLEEPLASNTRSEDVTVVHIPLVNDSLPEPPESFFVSLGFHDPDRGHIERVATVRVDILDDD